MRHQGGSAGANGTSGRFCDWCNEVLLLTMQTKNISQLFLTSMQLEKEHDYTIVVSWNTWLILMIINIRTTLLFSPWENPELSCHERKSIAMDTRDQSSQPVWHVARTKRITVPKCGKILCQKSKTVSLLRQCAYPKPLLHPSAPIARGHQHESLSLRSTSASRMNLEVLHQLTNVALLYIPQKVGFMHHRMAKYKVRSVLSQTVHWKLSPLIVNVIKHQ